MDGAVEPNPPNAGVAALVVVAAGVPPRNILIRTFRECRQDYVEEKSEKKSANFTQNHKILAYLICIILRIGIEIRSTIFFAHPVKL